MTSEEFLDQAKESKELTRINERLGNPRAKHSSDSILQRITPRRFAPQDEKTGFSLRPQPMVSPVIANFRNALPSFKFESLHDSKDGEGSVESFAKSNDV